MYIICLHKMTVLILDFVTLVNKLIIHILYMYASYVNIIEKIVSNLTLFIF